MIIVGPLQFVIVCGLQHQYMCCTWTVLITNEVQHTSIKQKAAIFFLG